MASALLVIAQIGLGIFGISWSKDGVSWNWRRSILWIFISANIATMGSIIYSVGTNIVEAFRAFSGVGIPSLAGPALVQQLIPEFDPAGANTFWILFRFMLGFLGVDLFLSYAIRSMVMKISAANMVRIARWASSFLRVSIKVVEGKS